MNGRWPATGIAWPGGGGQVLWTPLDLGATLQGWWDSSDALAFTLINTDRVQEWRAKGASSSRLTVGMTEGSRQPQRTASGVVGLDNQARLQGRQGAGTMSVAATFTCFDQRVSAEAGAYVTILGTREETPHQGLLGIGAADPGGYRFFQFTATLAAGGLGEGWLDGTQLTPQGMADLSNWQNGILIPEGGESMLYTGLTPAISFPDNNYWILLNDSATSDTRGFNLGPVQHVMLFARALTTDERQRVEGWTAHNVGELGRLPANHPYKTAPPMK